MTPQDNQVIRERIVNAPARQGVSGTDYRLLKAREKELTDQRQELEERREELAQQLGRREGADLAGVQQRLTVIDQRLQQIEIDLNQVGREAVAAAPTSIVEPEIKYIYRGNSDEDMVAAGFGGAFITLALLSPFFFRMWRRRRRAGQTSPNNTPVFGTERIDRMENAIDSIAVEIERVAENQRFMTRLMTETQLADTLAAVRGSTEAARIAAEKASNA
jgi:hypothetical protein